MEGLVRAQGFEDAVVTLTDESVNIVVKSDGMEPVQVGQIFRIAMEQTGLPAGALRLTPFSGSGGGA